MRQQKRVIKEDMKRHLAVHVLLVIQREPQFDCADVTRRVRRLHG